MHLPALAATGRKYPALILQVVVLLLTIAPLAWQELKGSTQPMLMLGIALPIAKKFVAA
jgi:hypothetical protein